MYTLEITKEIPLSHCGCYTSICKVDDILYLCDPFKLQVIAYDILTSVHAIYEVEKKYTHICYCEKFDCFYGLVEKDDHTLYQLDHHFHVQHCYPIEVDSSIPFTCVACHQEHLYIAQGFFLLRISLLCMSETEVIMKENYPLQNIAYCCQYMLTTTVDDCRNAIRVYTHRKEMVLTTCLPISCSIVCITCDKQCIYILVKETCQQYRVLICHITRCRNKNNECQDLIQSIALMETALSHILNAEGEKIQKAIAISEDVSCLLEINESVKETITQVTHLEQVLFAKLEVASKLCKQKRVGCEKECD